MGEWRTPIEAKQLQLRGQSERGKRENLLRAAATIAAESRGCHGRERHALVKTSTVVAESPKTTAEREQTDDSQHYERGKADRAIAAGRGFELKIMQEVVMLAVFSGFAIVVLKERFAWNYAAAFVCLGAAAFFAFGFRSSPS